jgi:hypothetical protein
VNIEARHPLRKEAACHSVHAVASHDHRYARLDPPRELLSSHFECPEKEIRAQVRPGRRQRLTIELALTKIVTVVRAFGVLGVGFRLKMRGRVLWEECCGWQGVSGKYDLEEITGSSHASKEASPVGHKQRIGQKHSILSARSFSCALMSAAALLKSPHSLQNNPCGESAQLLHRRSCKAKQPSVINSESQIVSFTVPLDA